MSHELKSAPEAERNRGRERVGGTLGQELKCYTNNNVSGSDMQCKINVTFVDQSLVESLHSGLIGRERWVLI